MTQVLIERSRPTEGTTRPLNVPRYTEVGGGRVLASFVGGEISGDGSVEVRRERARSYPGLLACAPQTIAFYRAFEPWLAGKSVLDVGCGSGAGASEMNAASRVVGVDRASVAVSYARQAVSGVSFETLDAERDELPQAEVVTLVDVLGEVEQPETVLRSIGQALGEGGVLCIAEAHASIAQELIAPMRQAFSRPGLQQLLRDCGFEVEAWLSEGTFLSLIAVHRATELSQGLGRADQLAISGRWGEAREALQGLTPSVGGQLRAAQIEIELGRGDAALSALMQAHESCPDDARVLSLLAELTLALGAPQEASRFAIAAAQRDPANFAVAFSLAQSVADQLPPAEKIALFANAARLAPADVDAAVCLARHAAGHEAYHVGIAALERVRNYHRQLPADFHLTLGWMYLMADRVEDALMESKIAKALCPEGDEVDELLAAICEVRPAPVGIS